MVLNIILKTVTQLIKKYSALFMEPEGSSSFSQKPATGPYPEPTESSSRKIQFFHFSIYDFR
jgi:hypothetical protein